jgi:S-adenosylmethionine decarboxylase
MKTKRFHHIFDLEDCNQKINDPKILRDFLEELVKKVKMSILEGPIIAQGKPENPGFSAVAIIDFSHVSIHTFANSKEVLIDVFSCKEYDKEKVLKLCKKYFASSTTKVRQKEVWWG